MRKFTSIYQFHETLDAELVDSHFQASKFEYLLGVHGAATRQRSGNAARTLYEQDQLLCIQVSQLTIFLLQFEKG